ncbi:MAG: cytochrome bd-I oxidase subunit CydX [Hyphomonas sp.]|nr:cytochrome bd-I oxidase subunit CydX [Hyphomonas sp.]MBA3067764.1 cytochrome bd-I oxidase subunit CydX [Hyphomonas sp.]MBU3919488.1 cytochrome bd-I oxidase subunit CydX [Alphaproteobacteria bacterium]MBU4062148.1 cytochrome bd-I oxidase subunit CydX [Alphaproteobacteria bacterium]MBU4165583.1 cytochrome bd-I oxidase subunit CydX [Alphaproteobacteria bacterium]
MWYFAWILGLGLALTFGILNALWNEFSPDGAACDEVDCDEGPA